MTNFHFSDLHQNCLAVLVPQLKAAGRPWAITGSLGLALQGFPCQPHDIDLICQPVDLPILQDVLRPWMVKPAALIAHSRIRSELAKLEVLGCPVELMGGLEVLQPDGSWQPPPPLAAITRWLQTQDWPLPVLDPLHELPTYRLLGRMEKAAAIQAWLNQ